MATNPRLRDWSDRHVWLVGASAGIGAALAQELSSRCARLTLTARSAEGLRNVATLCGSGTHVLPADVTDPDSLDRLFARFDRGDEPLPEIGIYLAGDYQPLDATLGESALPAARRLLAVNYSGAVEWSQRFAARLLAHPPAPEGARERGLALVASVAGYTGLPKALAYAPAKAALIRYAECLHLDLAPRGLGVWLINPGFVATRLTAQNDFPMPALISSQTAAQEIVDGFAAGRFEIHFPKRFTRVMKLLAALPYAWSLPLIARTTRSSRR